MIRKQIVEVIAFLRRNAFLINLLTAIVAYLLHWQNSYF